MQEIVLDCFFTLYKNSIYIYFINLTKIIIFFIAAIFPFAADFDFSPRIKKCILLYRDTQQCSPKP